MHSNNVFSRCYQGQACYATAFVFTLTAAVIAFGFSLQLHFRRIRLVQNELPYLD
jgi:hypothetical protein